MERLKKTYDLASGGWKLTYGKGRDQMMSLLFLSPVAGQWYACGVLNAGPFERMGDAVKLFEAHCRRVYPSTRSRCRARPHLKPVGRTPRLSEICMPLPPGVWPDEAPRLRGKKDLPKWRAWHNEQCN